MVGLARKNEEEVGSKGKDVSRCCGENRKRKKKRVIANNTSLKFSRAGDHGNVYVGVNIKYRYVECRIRKYSPRSLCVKASSRGTRGSISSQHYGRRVSPGRLPRDVMQSSKIFPGSFLVDENGNEHEVYRDLTKLRLGRRKTKIR